jgi:hypothetical protein
MAAFFAGVFILCIGVCGYSTTHSDAEFGGTAGALSFIGMAISAVSLLVIGVAAVINFFRN